MIPQNSPLYGQHTIIDAHLVRSLAHSLVVTPQSQLAERWQSCRAQPHL